MYARFVKRIIDIIFSIFLIVSLSWLFLLIVLVYLICMERHVLFMQKRIGRNDMPFVILKFRTLKDLPGPLEERRFALGNFLRSTSFDELPQLFNVLKGEMSLIGPRPLPVEYIDLFSDEQRIRHRVRPGITGWAQVNGRTAIGWPEKFRLDAFYVENMSFGLDLKIIVKTILLLVRFKRDASLDEKAFTGNE